MKSRKTGRIAGLLNSATDSGLKKNGNFVVVKHPLDDICMPDKIGRHDVVSLEDPDEIYHLITSHTKTVIIAGMAHYKENLIVELVDATVRSGRSVIGTGLNLDAEGKPYGNMAPLMALADEVQLTKAICSNHLCLDDQAKRSRESIDKSYEPVCSYHFTFKEAPPVPKNVAGSLELIVGPMFASKTEALVEKIQDYKFLTVPFVVFKWTNDARYGEEKRESLQEGFITTHNETKIPAVAVNNANDIKRYLDAKENKKIRTVLIDEGQFIEGVYDLVFKLIPQGYKFHISGLARGYNRKPFGDIPSLMCLADNIDFRSSICVKCYEPATESHRIEASEGDTLIQPGGKGAYEARCLKDWSVPKETEARYKIIPLEI